MCVYETRGMSGRIYNGSASLEKQIPVQAEKLIFWKKERSRKFSRIFPLGNSCRSVENITRRERKVWEEFLAFLPPSLPSPLPLFPPVAYQVQFSSLPHLIYCKHYRMSQKKNKWHLWSPNCAKMCKKVKLKMGVGFLDLMLEQPVQIFFLQNLKTWNQSQIEDMMEKINHFFHSSFFGKQKKEKEKEQYKRR